MSEALELTLTKVIPAAQKEVFDAWLTPDALKAFMRPGEGMTVPTCEVDARVGGQFQLVMKAGDQEIPHHGTYQTIDRHHRLVFTWQSPFSVDDSTVTLTFEALGDRETKVTLHHIHFPSQESRDNHEGGWKAILDVLAATVS